MIRVVVVLAKSLSNLGRCHANHGVKVHIVVWFASESLDTDCPFLQLARIAIQRLFNGIREQHRIPLAVCEQWVRQKAPQLFTH